jgi:hypothetical protein
MKNITISILFVLFSISAFSQFHFGLRAGLSSSQIKINETVNGLKISTGDNKFGYHVGLFSQIIFNKKFVVMPELLFTSTGGNIDLNDGTNVSEVWNLQYNRMDIPLNFGFKFLKIFRISAGPYASILLSADARQDNISQDVKNNYKNMLWGYQAGLGVDFWMVVVDLKYEGSFHSAHNNNVSIPGTEAIYSPDSRPNQWILSVGIRLF